jgi:tRNA A-37 threonylcarbamoyl transferase component Bud32
MSTLGTLIDANKLASEKHGVALAINEPINLLLLHHLLNRGEATAITLSNELALAENLISSALLELIELGLVIKQGNGFLLAESTKRRVGYAAFSVDHIVGQTIAGNTSDISHPLPGSYAILEKIGRGATSVTFKAKQADTHADRTLKIFFPESINYERLDAALEKRSKLSDEALPEIIEAGYISVQLKNKAAANCLCVVMKYIDGETYGAFLKRQQTLDQNVVNRFIERIGGALAAIEGVGLQHGDLHERNILVSSKKTDFWVIDFIGVPSSSSKELHILTDIENFRNHLIRMSLRVCQLYPGVSAKILMGYRSFRILEGLRSNTYKNFTELLADFRKPQIIPAGYFVESNEKPFAWLRVEQIADPVVLYKLFEPARARFDVISRFGNTWITGPSGSGKSHYLRVLEFHPKAIIAAEEDEETAQQLKSINYDYRKAFGILFPCRLGEFRVFTPEVLGHSSFDSNTQLFLKYILVLKIWNKALITIRRGLEFNCPRSNAPFLQMPSLSEMEILLNFLQERLGRIETVGEESSDALFKRCM